MPHVTPRWVSSAGARWKSRDPLEFVSPQARKTRQGRFVGVWHAHCFPADSPNSKRGRVSAITLKNKAKPKRLGKQRDWLTISGVNPLTLWRGSGTPSCDRGRVYAARLPLRFCDQLLVHGRDGAAKGAPDRAGATGGHRDGERALVLILLDPISSSAS